MESYIGSFCPYCGVQIKETDTVIVCPGCNVVYHEGCWNDHRGCATVGCGYAPAATPTAPVQDIGLKEVCASCGTPMDEDQAFCPMCGAARPAHSPVSASTSAQTKPKACTKCGQVLEEGQMYCGVCGQKADFASESDVSAAIHEFGVSLQQKKKKKTPLPWILGAVGLTAVVLVLVLVLALSGPKVEEITLSDSAVELKVDDTYVLSYTITPSKASDADVAWKSSNEGVATVSSYGKVTARAEGSCRITAEAGGERDTVKVTVKDSPDFKALFDQYCESTWADYGDDYLSLDTNPYDWEDDGGAYLDAYYAAEEINIVLGLPDSLIDEMGETTAGDGQQRQSYDNVTVTWTYHPDEGLEITYRAN